MRIDLTAERRLQMPAKYLPDAGEVPIRRSPLTVGENTGSLNTSRVQV